uniref:Uncharacterized protein n=1 Tax=Trypanosoma congolense (strain IL3000) TaxID=1068625 RepID=G0UXY4_TRYCI|nr:conserved hypothetical protein [Trypanosoma congolense IL3000]
MLVSLQRKGAAAYSCALVGHPVASHNLSPVIEWCDMLWQWRTVAWRERLFAVPFLLHCAGGVPSRSPFLQHAVAEQIVSSGKGGATHPQAHGQRHHTHVFIPSPIGDLSPAVGAPLPDAHPMTLWVDGLFDILQQGMVCVGTSEPRQCVPPMCRNVIGSGLAELVIAIDHMAAMVARRHITLANACWAILVDSKADIKPYLRFSALSIEKELLVMSKAHETANVSLGDPLGRPPLTLTDYPSVAGWV